MTVAKLYRPDEKSGLHKPNSNSTPRLPGSHKARGPLVGDVIIPKKVVIQKAKTPVPVFHVPDDYIGPFMAEWNEKRGIK